VGTARNSEKAFTRFSKAAEAGSLEGMYQLALMYQYVDQRDINKVIYWFTSAAEKGHVNSMASLGLIYYSGQCNLGNTLIRNPLTIKQDREEARKWFIKAAREGNLTAIDMLKNY
jgi:uncharacterized protein